MRLSRLLAALALIAGGCSSPHKAVDVEVVPPTPALVNIPAAAPADRTLHLDHKYFEIYYSPEFRLAKYVRYSLTADQLRARRYKRGNRFHEDDQLKALNQESVKDSEYKKTGYDRGHLAPAEDFAWSQEAMDETFVLSNVSPQKPSLNRGPWKRLEERVRRWACGEEKITVYSGPILEPGLKRLKSGLPVPREFFKLVIDETPPKKYAAFILKQTDKGETASKRTVSLNELTARLHENLAFDANVNDARKPAQVNDWKEKNCDRESNPR